MKKTTTRLAAAAFIGILSANSEAQTTTAPKKVFGSGELPEFLKAYDINADGKLSVEERQAYEKASREARPKLPNLKNRWDLDGDGKLSDAEKQAARDAISAKIKAELLSIPQITAEKVDAMVLHLDKTLPLDGQISLAEFTAALSPVEPSFPPLPPVPAPRVIAIPLLKPLDANKDGFVTALEFSALDADKDGKITPTEWKAYLMANPSLLPSAHPASLSN
jgi:Ca2+-binding EF-hand superfamily protein